MTEEPAAGMTYAERVKQLIETGLSQGDSLSKIQAEGRLVIIECFTGELEQATELVKFLEILLLYGRAKDEQEHGRLKPSFFGKKRYTELGQALNELEFHSLHAARSKVEAIEREARRAKRYEVYNQKG